MRSQKDPQEAGSESVFRFAEGILHISTRMHQGLEIAGLRGQINGPGKCLHNAYLPEPIEGLWSFFGFCQNPIKECRI